MTSESTAKIKSFEDLKTWQEAHKLAMMVYEFTGTFPPSEAFGLVSQMRRAAVSITANIAEGFSRKTNKDKCQFYAIASGSLTELKSEAVISKDLGYIPSDIFAGFGDQSVFVGKLLSGLKRIGRSTQYQIPNTKY